MHQYYFLLWPVIGMVSAGAATMQRPSIRDHVRQHGPVRMSVMSEYSPADLPEIAKAADVVMLGVIVEGRSLLNKDETEVLSDYEVQVERLIGRGRATVAVGDTVIVRRQGGTVTVDNVEVVATENDFPQFAEREKYVLFLKKLDDAAYEVVYGPQGAFKIQDDTVRQVSEVFGSWNANRGSVALADFFQEVKRHISQ